MTTTLSQPKILVVDDEPRILEVITFLLEEEQYQVLPAPDGQVALSLLTEIQPDLIVSDVWMPGLDGFALCQRVRANPALSHIPFIFLTARGEKEDIRRGMALGADDYLTKPFDPEELLSAVKVRLARAAETRAAIAKAGTDLQDQIIRTLTHEFRSPLALVAGYTELLEASGKGMAEQDFEAILQGLHAGSSRLAGLIEDFLLLSRLRTGAIARELSQEFPSPLAPEPIVRLAVAQARSMAATRDVSLVANYTTSELTVAITNEHLVEIVRRLIDNAIKFSKCSGGQVLVTTCRHGDSWVLTIGDDGVGIRQEALPRIFDPFWQADRHVLEQQGLGVGLAIVRGLVEAYGGRVGVKSALGEGSIFTIWLPLCGK